MLVERENGNDDWWNKLGVEDSDDDGEEVTVTDSIVVNEEEEEHDPLDQHPRKKTRSNHRECIAGTRSPGALETLQAKFRPVVYRVIPFGGVVTTM